MRKLLNPLVFCLVGLGTIIAGVFLPPVRLLTLVMPGAAEAFRDDLVTGLWYFKVAVVLAGMVVAVFPILVKYLWEYGGERGEGSGQWTVKAVARWENVVLAFVVLLALVLRLVGAGQSFNGDEVLVQHSFVGRGLPVILTYWPASTHHIGYEIFAWFSEQLPFSIEFASRLPAVLFGTLAVWAGYFLTRMFLTPLVSMCITFIHAVSLFAIMHSNMLKGYSCVHLCFLLSLMGIVKILSQPTETKGWLMLGISLAIMPYMHLHTVFLVVGIVLTFLILWLFTVGSNVNLHLFFLRRSVLLFGLAALGLLLVYSIPLPQIIKTAQGMSERAELPLSIDFFKGWLMQMTFWNRFWYVSIIAIIFATIGAIRMIKLNLRMTVLLFAPVVAVLFFTWLTSGFIYPRYMVFSVPVFLVFLVMGLDAFASLLPSCFLRGTVLCALTTVFIVCQLPAMGNYYKYGNQNLRGAVELVRAKRSEQRAEIHDVRRDEYGGERGVWSENRRQGSEVRDQGSGGRLTGRRAEVRNHEKHEMPRKRMGRKEESSPPKADQPVAAREGNNSCDTIVAYGLARKLFVLFDEDIKPVADLQELQDAMEAAGDKVYLLYAWRKSWKSRDAEFKWIDEHFETIHRFPGMLMDTTEPDGDVVLLVWERRVES